MTDGRPRRALLLLNPGARRGGEGIDGVLDRLRAGGVALDEQPMESPEAATRCLREAAERVDCAIVGGGDGSLRMAAAGVEASGLPLGILPIGTANDLARTLGIPTDLEAAADVILAGHRQRIDLGTVNDQPFFNVASIGLSTELARGCRATSSAAGAGSATPSPRSGRWRRPAGSAPGSPRTATPPAPAPCRSPSATAASTAAATSSPSTPTIDDGHLDLYSLETRTVWRLALMLMELPLRRARRLVRGDDAARHRVRDPHPPARGRSTPTARSSPRRRRCSASHPAGDHRLHARAGPAAAEAAPSASPHRRIPASELRF